MKLAAVQAALQERGIYAWLLYDFRHMNPIANRVAGISAERHTTRRWFALIPARGEPRWLHSAMLRGTRCPQGLKPVVLFPICTG